MARHSDPQKIAAWLLLAACLSGPAAAQPTLRRVWKGRLYQAPAHRYEDWGPGRRQLRSSLDGFPLEVTSRLEGDRFQILDANQQFRAVSSAAEAEGRTLFWMETGEWKNHPEWRQGAVFAAPGAVPVNVTVDEQGDLARIVYPGHTVEYQDWAVVEGLRTPRRRVADGDPWELERVEPSAALPPLQMVSHLHFPAGGLEMPLSLWGTRVLMTWEGQRFFLDTGSGTSTFDLSRARREAWPTAGQLSLPSQQWKGDLRWIRTPALQLGGLAVDPVTVLSLEFEGSRLAENLGDLRGLIGDDLLSQAVVQIDYPGSRLRFLSAYQPDEQDREIPLRVESNMPYVEIQVNGRTSSVLLDTGSPETLFLPRVPGLQVAESLYDPQGVRFAVATAGGWPGRGDLRLGPFRWKGAPLTAIDPVTAQGPVVSGPGVLGYGVLRHFRVTLDLTGGHLWLAQRLPFRQLKLATWGMCFELQDGRMLVVSLAPGGPAARAGLRVGDEIVAFNGMSAGRLRDWGNDVLPQAPDESGEFHLLRGGRAFTRRIRAAAIP